MNGKVKTSLGAIVYEGTRRQCLNFIRSENDNTLKLEVVQAQLTEEETEKLMDIINFYQQHAYKNINQMEDAKMIDKNTASLMRGKINDLNVIVDKLEQE